MDERLNVLVTGASGFVGSSLVKMLSASTKYRPLAVYRGASASLPSGVDSVFVRNLSELAGQSAILSGVDVVIHAAARVHVMNEVATDPLSEFRKVNVEDTLNLARQAAATGVRRFIFISSIKVNGEFTLPGKPFTADAVPAPMDPYGVSKFEAEQALLELATRSSMEIVIIRPTLIYGPGVKANFQSMMNWLYKRIPLPFGSIDNKRSLVSLGNLSDLVRICMQHPAAANQIFLVSDGESLSTTQLLRRTASALGRKALLVPVPMAFLVFAARLLRKPALSQRLCGSLEVDINKTRNLLNWEPPVSVDDALRETARHFMDKKEK